MHYCFQYIVPDQFNSSSDFVMNDWSIAGERDGMIRGIQPAYALLGEFALTEAEELTVALGSFSFETIAL